MLTVRSCGKVEDSPITVGQNFDVVVQPDGDENAPTAIREDGRNPLVGRGPQQAGWLNAALVVPAHSLTDTPVQTGSKLPRWLTTGHINHPELAVDPAGPFGASTDGDRRPVG